MNIRPNKSRAPAAVPPPSLQQPPAQTKRSRRKVWVIALLALAAIPGWWIWDAFVRTSAYAVVEVEQVEVAAPLSGLIESMRVREDGDYDAETTAFAIVDRSTRDELEALQIQLRLIESQILEKSVNLRLSQADRLYERDALIADRRAQLGEATLAQAHLSANIAKRSAELPLREYRVHKLEELVRSNSISDEELVAARTDHESAAKELEGLILAQRDAAARIDALRGMIARPVPEAPDIEVSIEPLRKQAELVRTQIEQLQSRLQESQVRLRVSGRVTRILHHPGEYVHAGDPVVIVAKPNDVRVVAYFQQDAGTALKPGMPLRVVSSYAPEITGHVARFRPWADQGPESIGRFHARGEPLLAVELEVDNAARKVLVPGSVVRVISSGSLSTVRQANAAERRE